VHALPALVALAVALLVTPAVLRSLRDAGFLRENYRGARLPFPAGIAPIASALLALAVLAPLHELAGLDLLEPAQAAVALYALGVSLLGLVDDALSTRAAGSATGPRGWRGHGAAVLAGGFSSGALKAAGSLGLGLYALSGRGWDDGRYLLAVAVLVLATNLFNLLDLRPGRSVKAFVILAAGLTAGTLDADPLGAVGLFAGPLLVVGLYDVRERAMLGDTGSNLTGALAGMLLVLALETTGLAIALAVLVGITAYGEFRSISRFIEKVPPLRRLDCLGRPHV
jgi:UDP-GlcNAc:undecaprenyl-phosphate/decaprenyl-phosphate GlcNAc-1-phosphate transferase